MVASAYVAQLARRAQEYGVEIDGGAAAVRVDMARVKARKDLISGESRTGVEKWLKAMPGCTVYEGHGRFEGPKQVRVDLTAGGSETIGAECIFINVGGRALVPPMPGLEAISYLTNSSMMDLDVLPQHLIVVGGSYIGLEFGQMFRRFGCEVTIIEMGDRLIGREDPDISAAILDILQREGIKVRLKAKCIAFANENGRITARVDCESGDREVHGGTHALLAVGRIPNTSDLGLDRAGLAVDARGYIVVDDQLRTNVPGIWAVGDCNGQGAFTHTSYNDAEIVVGNLLEHDPRGVSQRITAYGLFVDPPLGRAGQTEAEVRKSGRRALIGTRPMVRVRRAVEKGESQGLMKIIVDAETHQILGAAILGPGGDEVIHSILDVMYAKAPYTLLTHAMHIHPTVSEYIPTVLGDLKPL
jgi:pyruvate/2-oxoglutarate dehydrogenase complex dihydrolipoamide dehydrogenase (E3) component